MMLILYFIHLIMQGITHHPVIFVMMYYFNFFPASITDARLINTYFINKDFDFLEPICNLCPQIECLVTEGSYSIPEDVSICVR